MRDFIKKTSAFSIFILFILVFTNFYGDAAKLFHIGYEKKIASILLEKKNATNISNYDERLLQKEIINNIDKNPDVVVLGSSRSKLIGSKYFDNKLLFNNGVNGASIEDLVAIYQLYKERDILPKKIVVVIDPWLFNEYNGLERWTSLEKEYNDFHNKTGTFSKAQENNFSELISLSYFQNSLNNLPNVFTGKSDPVSTTQKYNKTNTKLPDGSIIYGEKRINLSQENIDNIARKYSTGKIYGIENFEKISDRNFEDFNSLCSDIIHNGIELEFILTPYHPITYKKIIANYPCVIKTENIIKNYAENANINCYGSFNPSVLEIDNSGLYDGVHSKEITISKIMKKRKESSTTQKG